ncbi:CHASE2 domain-containing protein [Pseudomonas chlororaphis]|uniref:histidine kinase n=1 Tax=Pseudomonas chlororaphis TaxID=587753 RepID=A0AAX3FU72_9PSED|nr:CHASE2 domain-containing protein [Pseudomonas chlororaphis]AZC39846.1 Signal transduction histidine kinase [Pseudomonas chlororaphis subsp. piscium]AZC46403.1 Signal transduction histidine kinase [Pseudomonas chlororaphis subsp. piscium]AZC59393.1 Signal transduction histidine kinase [Pseudomonas chlororaphis subsp. piscium]WDG71909.1 CHASE2 and HATPase_c domain-containing protein [Pseudomonas chlororaphis]WDH30307.1 CHASE2 and HATPase_c domain-containing protein [Pseudomonas chlororaphis]
MLSAQLLFRKTLQEGIIIALLLLPTVGYVATFSQWQLDRLIYDKLALLMSSPLDPRILLITIDDASINAIGRWPWTRDLHTQLLEKLAPLTPTVVLYDVIFTEPDSNPETDRRLGAAMAKVAHVVVPTLREANPVLDQAPRFLSPIKPVLEGAQAVGHIYVPTGIDGVVRQVYLKEGNAEGQRNLLTWQAYAATFAPDQQPVMPEICCARDLGGQWFGWNEVLIPFSKKPSSVPSVSFSSVLNGEVPDELLRNRIILVGVTASGLGDRHPTPLSTSSGNMPGIVLHAHLLNGFLHQHLVKTTPIWMNISLSTLSVLAVLAMLSTFRLRRTFLVCLGMIIARLMLSLALLTLGWWSAPGASLAGILAAYLFWSWRRLNALVVYFGVELDRMELELKGQPAPPKPVFRGDELVGRALALESMIAHLRGSQRFIAQSLDSLPLAIFVTDLNGQVRLANLNAATLDGKSGSLSSSLIGQDIFQILRELEPKNDSLASPWPQSFISVERLAGQFIHTPSGQVFKMQLAPLGTEKSEHSGWLLVLLDFTVEYLAQEQRDSMLRFLSHDLRAPQSAILALLEMQQKVKEPMPVGELRRHIEQQVRRTLSLTDGFMELDEAKSKPLVFEPVFVGAIILDAIDQAWLPAQHKGIRIKHRFIDDETCVINGCRELLTRAIFNLLENAVKYSGQDTVVYIELMLQETAIVLSIRDEGQGIAEEDLPHLFDEFRQFGTGNKRGNGYGLGMAFVNSVMQRHSARIECTSRVDLGTTFVLIFQVIN